MTSNDGPRLRVSARKRTAVDDDDQLVPVCATRNCPRPTTFRPLIGSDGEFLCDEHYREEYPATAMIDQAEESIRLQEEGGVATRLAARVQGQMTSVVRKANDALATTGTAAAAERERERREEEECRLCLEPGVLRKCCGRYYCHHCFFIRGGPCCPGCEGPANLTGIGARSRQIPTAPGRCAVAVAYCLSLIVALSLVLGGVVSYVNWWSAPTTIFGRRCRGLFEDCGLNLCAEAEVSPAGTTATMPIDYRQCAGNNASAFIVGSGCVFDRELYSLTGGELGYDFCASSPLDAEDDITIVSGAYVFFDDFDHGGELASARWAGDSPMYVGDTCGVHDDFEAWPYAATSSSSTADPGAALIFADVHFRLASTDDMVVPFGGRVEFHLKFGPAVYGNDADESSCKPAYNAGVTLSFSLDQGLTWTKIAVYSTFQYRSHEFVPVRETIPVEAWSNQTRFRWQQELFDPVAEHWSMDDVRIFASFEPQWTESSSFALRKRLRDESILASQCDHGTEQCSNYEKLTHTGRTADYFVFLAAVIFVIKRTYAVIAKRTVQSRIHEQNKVSPGTCTPIVAESSFPKESFSLHRQRWWILLNTWLLTSPLLTVVAIVARSYGMYGSSWKSASSFTASILLDSYSVYNLLNRVFQAFGSSFRVNIDCHPDYGYFAYREEHVPLQSLIGIQVLSGCYIWVLYFSTIISGLPYTSACYLARIAGFPTGIHRLYVRSCGTVALLRVLLGCNFISIIVRAFQYTFSMSSDTRDALGCAVKRGGAIQTTSYVTALCVGSAMILVKVFESSLLPVHARIVLLTAFVGGVVFGLLVAVLRGLPVATELILTRPPTIGQAIIFGKKARCPCLFTCKSCEDVHSCQRLLLVYPHDDENLSLVRLLRGESSS